MPLNSDEPLWEWYLPTDCLFFSKGAAKQLNLPKMPESMSEYYKLLPRDAAIELASAREDAISGLTGSIAQCDYLYDGKWYQEILMVLTRDTHGRATRVMGRIETIDGKQGMGFRNTQRMLFEAGLWLYDVKNNLLWRDSACDAILGLPRGNYPLPASESLFNVHPSERDAIRRHYELFCKSPFLGDSITDIVRVKSEPGHYVPVLARATVLRRDGAGRAELVLGLMAPGEARQITPGSLKKDSRIFHALNNMGSGQWNWDTKKDTIYFCPRYLEKLGYRPEQENEFARNWREHIHPDDRAKVAQAHREIVDSPAHGDTYECTYRMECADSSWAWIFEQGCVTWRDADGRAGHIIGSITNITTAQEERDKLEELVRHDVLTGLRSRAFCELELEHIEQNELRPVCLISIDITGLKMVNDYLGHARGDALLIRAAKLLRGALRRSDCIGRMGGDEFLIILPGCDYRKGTKVMRKLGAAISSYNSKHPPLPVFAAFGMASAETAEQSMAETMKLADQKMYEHKKDQRQLAHKALKALIFKETGQKVGVDERLADAP